MMNLTSLEDREWQVGHILEVQNQNLSYAMEWTAYASLRRREIEGQLCSWKCRKMI